MKVTNDEISQKKELVKDLIKKYPELKISSDAIIRFEASEISRLVQLLLFDEKLACSAVKIQSYYRMLIHRREFLIRYKIR